MRRAGLLFCTDCAAERFATLRKRDQLPFPADDREAARWQQFSLRDAFDLRLLMDGMDHNGLSFDEAIYVQNGLHDLDCHPLDRPMGDPDVWVAGGCTDDAGDGLVARFFAAGELHELPQRITAKLERRAGDPFRIVLLNASRAARFVRNRAVEMGLPEGADFAPVWGRDAS